MVEGLGILTENSNQTTRLQGLPSIQLYRERI